jgi:hypothetical protein
MQQICNGNERCSPYPLFGHAVDTGGNKHGSTQHRDACGQRLLIIIHQQASPCDYQSTSISGILLADLINPKDKPAKIKSSIL